MKSIVITGAAEHNLKQIDLEIPRDRLVVVTGVSGSGKSSLAFDTIYAEGQRRYVESLSTYARQFLEQMEKPRVESIEGLSPAIAIEQRSAGRNPRSTVGTVTEIYDHLRLLFARVGHPHCPECGREVAAQTVQQMVDRLLRLPEGTRLQVLAPVVRGRKGAHRGLLERLLREGFIRARVDGEFIELERPPALDARRRHTIEVVVDRLVVRERIAGRLADSLEIALKQAEGVALAWHPDVEPPEQLFSETLSCHHCGTSFPELAPRSFSFNSPHGACPQCDGLGASLELDPGLVVPDPGRTVRAGAFAPLGENETSYFFQMVEGAAAHFGIDLDQPWKKLAKKQQRILLEGSGDTKIEMVFKSKAMKHAFNRPFEGVLPLLRRRYRETSSPAIREQIEKYMVQSPCRACNGERLRRESLAVTLGEMNISACTRLTVRQALEQVAGFDLTGEEREIAGRVLREISERLSFLANVGLDYLTLDRRAATLSGGESQRIRLATQIGSRLSGVLYVLDEPSIGLHQRDNQRLLETLRGMRDLGNTVLVVEHDLETMLQADLIIDLGPGAGVHGGEVVAMGTPEEVRDDPRSLTGQYLSGAKAIEVPERRRTASGRPRIEIVGASQHNLKAIDVAIPLGLFTVVTGVSGSGKSTLVLDILYRALARKLHGGSHRPGAHRDIRGLRHVDRVIDIDQSPIGRTPRSNPATYTGLMTHVRQLFAGVPESRVRGYGPGRFSFNVKGGRCEACAGDGIIRIEMHFLPDVYVTCGACKGRRYNRETLEVLYRGKSIAQVLEMTVNQASRFFENIPAVRNRLETLINVGLGYIKLGQSATTLSGGEAQRVKLSRELSKRSTGRTLYILDEPTTGLHFDDIRKLLRVLDSLTESGNTVVVIEHNLDVIKCADHIIDLGPEGGDNGGEVVVQGPPEKVARSRASHTGRFLAEML